MNIYHQEEVNRVWDRVLGNTKQPPSDSGHAEPRDWFCQERQAACRYAALASKTNGRAAQLLRQIAQEKLAHAKQLAALIYVQTGQCPQCRPEQAAVDECLCQAIRRQIAAEQELAQAYRTASEADGTEAPVLRCLSRRTAAHARQLLCLLSHMM